MTLLRAFGAYKLLVVTVSTLLSMVNNTWCGARPFVTKPVYT